MSETFVFQIQGHPTRYHLTPLLLLYGSDFCTSFARVWRTIYGSSEYSPATSYAYFKRMVRFFLVIGEKGIVNPQSAEGRIYRCYSLFRGKIPETEDLEQCLSNTFDALCDRNDTSFGTVSSPSSINSEIDTIKSVMGAFSRVGFAPKFTFSAGLPEDKEARTPTLATLAREAGRFSTTNLGRLQAAEAFVKQNADLLMELRRCLCEEFGNEYHRFVRGKRLREDPRLPDEAAIISLLDEYNQAKGDVREWFRRRLSIDDDLYEGLVFKLVSATLHRGLVVKSRKLATLMKSVGDPLWIQGHIQATAVALNAAFHIVIIDSAFNSQPCKDLKINAISGRERRGRFELVTATSTKNRKNGARNSKQNEVDVPLVDEGGWLPKKVGEQISAKRVIEQWLEMTSMLRSSPQIRNTDRDRLWIFQRPLEPTIRSRLQSIDSEWWPAFLKRQGKNALIGGLRITRMVIRRTALNRSAEMDDFGLAMNQELGNHSDGFMPFFYLDKNGAKAVLEEMIRKFADKWEAIALYGIPHAAKVLGINEQELHRQKLLGLESGLQFAQVDRKSPRTSPSEEKDTEELPLIDKNARVLRISDKSMAELYLAKLGLERRAERMLSTNPSRFLRVWVPWTAIVDGYILKIQESRFWSAFERICRDIDAKLLEGKATVPCIW